MSFKQKFVSAITLAFAIVTFTVFASAQDKTTEPAADAGKQERKGPGRHGEGRGPGMRGGKRGGPMGMLRGLQSVDLTEEQRTRIRTIMDSKRDSFKQVHDQMRELGRAKHEGTITAEQQTQFDQLRAQIKQNSEATRQEILGILTADQKAKLEQFKQEMKQRKAERRERGPRPGRGEGPSPTDKPTDN